MPGEDTHQQPSESVRDSTSDPLPMQSNTSNPTDFKLFVDDDTFQTLQKHFHMTGKGRRPDLPQVEVTRRLLLQLYILKEEV